MGTATRLVIYSEQVHYHKELPTKIWVAGFPARWTTARCSTEKVATPRRNTNARHAAVLSPYTCLLGNAGHYTEGLARNVCCKTYDSVA